MYKRWKNPKYYNVPMHEKYQYVADKMGKSIEYVKQIHFRKVILLYRIYRALNRDLSKWDEDSREFVLRVWSNELKETLEEVEEDMRKKGIGK
ncbi:hypothetical protein [Sutcliffiella sp. NC1]|uniref:hypothetical protein n=1 Tax=Sutcliffiella sp. NC1 TaxID=3004096 RepID=UPI0022DE112E|nr:hypothetical protein [Sutcliffiella sp. NC1]WBL16357.1 hypothetical protein O1A01_06920 [Sutcliffiella sp. NC1]